jgi:hypothetical protein
LSRTLRTAAPNVKLKLTVSFSNKTVSQSILVLLYILLCTKDFPVDGLAGEGWLIGPHGLLLGGGGGGLHQRHHAQWKCSLIPILRQKITGDIAVVPVDVLFQVRGEVKFCFDICMIISGAHIELH